MTRLISGRRMWDCRRRMGLPAIGFSVSWARVKPLGKSLELNPYED